MMTVGELKQLLDGLDDDCELRIATQPSYPFENAVGPLVQIGANDAEMQEIQQALGGIGDDKLTAEEAAEAESELSRLNCENRQIVYIGCGRQLGYLSGEVKEELMGQGWYG